MNNTYPYDPSSEQPSSEQPTGLIPHLPEGCADLGGRPPAQFWIENGGTRYRVVEGARLEDSGELYRWDPRSTITTRRTLHVCSPQNPAIPIITAHFPGDTQLDAMALSLQAALIDYLAKPAANPTKSVWHRLFR